MGDIDLQEVVNIYLDEGDITSDCEFVQLVINESHGWFC